MLCKVFLCLLLISGVLALECVFQVKTEYTKLDIEGGVDKCESSDGYCAKLNYDGINAKGCSMTAGKILGVTGLDCTDVGCSSDGSWCCCKGDKCNSSQRLVIFMPLAILAAVKMFL
ncbi:hypothetical protein CRE_21782 [Caenorhabditis remanei]|uniref:Uncharacterized protein n=1 Tax=Caenorhabditis remanei TaxID=31234 RepID=E3MEF8_CAERE|nr:hypothetical protein CRE_21782 [Caenorhabditis remanei]